MSTDQLHDQVPNILSILGERIRLARKHLDLSQIELAQLVGVSDKAISSYEVGRAVPPLDILKKISEYTRKPVGYFFDEPEERQSELRDRLERMQEELDELRKLVS
ncbi:MAG: hypothetical protein KatS3mg087_1989 [Patescibacteria group bacterium]|nr:MAG: hypothetical protein KatS3mg087_1989 [Patescibacteria group bacterium]